VLSFINKLGTQVISARTFVNTIMSYIFLFSGAFASGNAIVTGYYVGEGDYQGAYKNTLKTVLSTSVIVLIIVTAINLFSYQIASLLTEDKVVIQTIRNVLWVCFLLEIGRVLNLVVIQSLRATGDTLFPLIMAVISMLGLGIPFAYLFSNTLGLGLVGIYLGYSVDEMFRGVIMTVRWLKKSWMNRSLVEG
jgi:Na+-driven multidrug efflux pump